MTFEQAKSEYGKGISTRWIACHATLGRKPAAYEYIVWNEQKWIEFADSINADYRQRSISSACQLKVGKDFQKIYDQWLVDNLP